MKSLYWFLIACVCVCVWGCTDPIIPQNEQDLVVEGWIEAGDHPIVMVTTSVQVSQKYQDWSVLEENLVRWAKVTVSDGENSVVLTGKYNKDYFPPYIYTTAKMEGEVGKTYTLTVQYKGKTATATTTIPEKVDLEYVKVVSSSAEDSEYNIIAGLKDDPATKDYYRFFTKNTKLDSTYIPSFLGLINDDVLAEGINDVSVYSGFVLNFGSEQRSPISFQEDDVISIRFATMDEDTYNYWEDYDDISSLSNNPFFPVNKKIRSNVSSGMGYWAGYGSSYYMVSIADSLALGRVWPAKD